MARAPALIVGVWPGVGLAVARKFGREGYAVHPAARRGAEVA